jgi:hypothetical protein
VGCLMMDDEPGRLPEEPDEEDDWGDDERPID